MESEGAEQYVEQPESVEPVAEPVQSDSSSVGAVQTVVLDDAQWLYIQSFCGYALACSFASFVLVGCIFGAVLSHFVGRAVNRG